MFSSKIWYKFDYFTLLITLALIGLGIQTINGATLEGSAKDWRWVSQLQFAVLGFFVLIGVAFIDYRTLVKFSPLFYVGGILLLVSVFLPGIGHNSHGAQSWIKLPGLPQVQPAEIVKLTTILMLARVLAARKENWNGLWDVVKPLMIGALPAYFILIQPDLGTAVVFVPITLAMMFVAGMPYGYLVWLLAPATCLFAVSHDVVYIVAWVVTLLSLMVITVYCRVPWTIWLLSLAVSVAAYFFIFHYGAEIWEKLPKHQTNRIVGYLNPEFDPKSTTWNINQAKIALGSGGFWGKGLGQGTQGFYQFLPEFEHDFVFPVLGEQFGFIGAVTLLLLFLLLLVRGIDTAIETKTLQGALMASGVVALFFSHIFINIGMVTGLLPVTGLPLTFISYGGSFLICSMIAVGFIINIRIRTTIEPLTESHSSNRPAMALPRKIKDEF